MQGVATPPRVAITKLPQQEPRLGEKKLAPLPEHLRRTQDECRTNND